MFTLHSLISCGFAISFFIESIALYIRARALKSLFWHDACILTALSTRNGYINHPWPSFIAAPHLRQLMFVFPWRVGTRGSVLSLFLHMLLNCWAAFVDHFPIIWVVPGPNLQITTFVGEIQTICCKIGSLSSHCKQAKHIREGLSLENSSQFHLKMPSWTATTNSLFRSVDSLS